LAKILQDWGYDFVDNSTYQITDYINNLIIFLKVCLSNIAVTPILSFEYSYNRACLPFEENKSKPIDIFAAH